MATGCGLRSRSGETSLRAQVTERVAPGVVYTTFHHPEHAGERRHHRLRRLGDELPRIQGDGGAGLALERAERLAGKIRRPGAPEPPHRRGRPGRGMSEATPAPVPPPVTLVKRFAYRDGAFVAGERVVPAETAVAFTYDRMTHAVMMATPADLEDFAVGFSLAEGIIRAPGDIGNIETVTTDLRHRAAHGSERSRAARCSPSAAATWPGRAAAACAASKASKRRCARCPRSRTG